MSFSDFFYTYIAIFTPDRLAGLLVVSAAVIVYFGLIRRISRMSVRQCVLLCLAMIYVINIYFVTVFSRSLESGIAEFMPFESYRAALRYKSLTILEYNFLNILVLMPLGGLLEEASGLTSVLLAKRAVGWITVLGALISLSIEILQYVLQCGVFETDDIIHNTLGAFLAAFVWYHIRRRCRRWNLGQPSNLSAEKR